MRAIVFPTHVCVTGRTEMRRIVLACNTSDDIRSALLVQVRNHTLHRLFCTMMLTPCPRRSCHRAHTITSILRRQYYLMRTCISSHLAAQSCIVTAPRASSCESPRASSCESIAAAQRERASAGGENAERLDGIVAGEQGTPFAAGTVGCASHGAMELFMPWAYSGQWHASSSAPHEG